MNLTKKETFYTRKMILGKKKRYLIEKSLVKKTRQMKLSKKKIKVLERKIKESKLKILYII